jgi:hypothetical protein
VRFHRRRVRGRDVTGHVDDFGVEACILIGNMGVESNAQVAPIAGVYFGSSFSAAPAR